MALLIYGHPIFLLLQIIFLYFVYTHCYDKIIHLPAKPTMEDEATDEMSSGAVDESNTTTVTEFQSLQQNSNELFDELRYLPQFGQKMWQPYFGKAFSLFTKANNNFVLPDNTSCLIC